MLVTKVPEFSKHIPFQQNNKQFLLIFTASKNDIMGILHVQVI